MVSDPAVHGAVGGDDDPVEKTGLRNARGRLDHMARVLRPGGRLMVLVWGRAPKVWWSPVIDLIESRAEYYAAVCPMMFFYGLPGVLARMAAEADLAVTHDVAVDETM